MLTLIIFLTQSRGAFFGVMVFGLLSVAGQHKRLRALFGTGVIAALVLVAAPSSVWDRLGGLSNLTSAETLRAADEEGSAQARYTIWNVALAISRDHPVTGVGIGAYNEVHYNYAQQTSQWYAARGRKDTHSAYLNTLAETGIPGLFALVGFVLSFGVFLWRAGRRLRAHSPRRAEQFKLLLAAWAAFWISAVFGSFQRIVLPYLFAGFATALAAQYGVLYPSKATGRQRSPVQVPASPAPMASAAGRG
jgi:O-antigen ligase